MSFLTRISRLVDNKPWASQLYLTDQCNLRCHYCNEYNNDNPHPDVKVLKARMMKLRELGVMRTNLLGGEPLLHPDVVELVRYARSIGFLIVGMSTNGSLLTKELIKALEEAGLSSLQISVDRMTPTEGTRKSLRTVRNKLDWFADAKINMTVTGVLYHETLDEMRQVIDTCVEAEIPVAARLIHDDLVNQRKFRTGLPTQKVLELLDYQIDLKKQGKRINTSWHMLRVQRAQLTGKPFRWKCVAGYKFVFVSATGKFWPCSQVRTDKDIMDVTPEYLVTWNHKKPCQDGCGVYCVIGTSFMINHPVRYIGAEFNGMLSDRMARRRRKRHPAGLRQAP